LTTISRRISNKSELKKSYFNDQKLADKTSKSKRDYP
jgi:hypothetical protein